MYMTDDRQAVNGLVSWECDPEIACETVWGSKDEG